MHRIIVLALGLMLVPLATAQSSAQTYTLDGSVTDQDGNPVAGADVYLYQYGQPEPAPEQGEGETKMAGSDYYQAQARTDDLGRFTIQARSGHADLSFSREGYAGAYQSVEVAGAQSLDVKMQKHPDRTAHVEGNIFAGGNQVPWVSLSIENPEYGLYACSTYAADKPADGSSSSSGSGAVNPATEPQSDAMISRPYYNEGCQITIAEDGSFSGEIWPGYSIIRAYYDNWRACPDGGCQEYYGFVEVRVLQDGDNQFDVRLKARPAADATVIGYVLDQDEQPIKGVYVSFSNQDTYSWGQAMTDADGSYKASLRSGFVEISVWADGYFPYYQSVDIASGENRIVIKLTAGQSQYGGGCCYAYAEDGGAKVTPLAAGAPATDDQANGASQDNAAGVRDLGGGLGPYQPSFENVDKESPGVGLLMVLAMLALVTLRRRS